MRNTHTYIYILYCHLYIRIFQIPRVQVLLNKPHCSELAIKTKGTSRPLRLRCSAETGESDGGPETIAEVVRGLRGLLQLPLRLRGAAGGAHRAARLGMRCWTAPLEHEAFSMRRLVEGRAPNIYSGVEHEDETTQSLGAFLLELGFRAMSRLHKITSCIETYGTPRRAQKCGECTNCTTC